MRELLRRILSLDSVVGAVAAATKARGISSSTVWEVASHESWQWSEPVAVDEQ